MVGWDEDGAIMLLVFWWSFVVEDDDEGCCCTGLIGIGFVIVDVSEKTSGLEVGMG